MKMFLIIIMIVLLQYSYPMDKKEQSQKFNQEMFDAIDTRRPKKVKNLLKQMDNIFSDNREKAMLIGLYKGYAGTKLDNTSRAMPLVGFAGTAWSSYYMLANYSSPLRPLRTFFQRNTKLRFWGVGLIGSIALWQSPFTQYRRAQKNYTLLGNEGKKVDFANDLQRTLEKNSIK